MELEKCENQCLKTFLYKSKVDKWLDWSFKHRFYYITVVVMSASDRHQSVVIFLHCADFQKYSYDDVSPGEWLTGCRLLFHTAVRYWRGWRSVPAESYGKSSVGLCELCFGFDDTVALSDTGALLHRTRARALGPSRNSSPRGKRRESHPTTSSRSGKVSSALLKPSFGERPPVSWSDCRVRWVTWVSHLHRLSPSDCACVCVCVPARVCRYSSSWGGCPDPESDRSLLHRGQPSPDHHRYTHIEPV